MTAGEPIWLTVRDVLAMHGLLLVAHGGPAGGREPGLLESTVAPPRQLSSYERPDLFDLAAGYAASLTRNHPFADGNKRTAFLAAFTFLGVNGHELRADEAEVVEAVVALTDQRMVEGDFARWLRENSVASKGTSGHRRKGATKGKGARKSRPRRK